MAVVEAGSWGTPAADIEEGCWGASAAESPCDSPPEPEETEVETKRNFVVAVAWLIVAIPSLVGTWCWPIVVAYALQVPWWDVISLEGEHMFYGLELVFYAVFASNLAQYAQWKAHKDPSLRLGAQLIACGAVLSLFYPFAIFIIYVGHVGHPDWKMWTDGALWPNTAHGIALLAARWVGLFMIGAGVSLLAKMPQKIRKQWAGLRK